MAGAEAVAEDLSCSDMGRAVQEWDRPRLGSGGQLVVR
jgi:hypothetical protein